MSDPLPPSPPVRRPWSRLLGLLALVIGFGLLIYGSFLAWLSKGECLVWAGVAAIEVPILLSLVMVVIAQRQLRMKKIPYWTGIAVAVVFLEAIAIPNVLSAMSRSKQKRTMADLRSLATAVEARATDYNAYPSARNLDELESLLSPTYIRTIPRTDGWGSAFYYSRSKNSDGTDMYMIGSAGKDRSWDQPELNSDRMGATSHFDCDIFYSNGAFIQYPEGVQQ